MSLSTLAYTKIFASVCLCERKRKKSIVGQRGHALKRHCNKNRLSTMPTSSHPHNSWRIPSFQKKGSLTSSAWTWGEHTVVMRLGKDARSSTNTCIKNNIKHKNVDVLLSRGFKNFNRRNLNTRVSRSIFTVVREQAGRRGRHNKDISFIFDNIMIRPLHFHKQSPFYSHKLEESPHVTYTATRGTDLGN